jgi:hypothetical protein
MKKIRGVAAVDKTPMIVATCWSRCKKPSSERLQESSEISERNAKIRHCVAVILPLASPEMRRLFCSLRSSTMRKMIALALAAGACACCGLASAHAADFSVPPQAAAPAPDYGPPPVAENYAYPPPPPPPVAYQYPPPPPPGYYVYDDVPAYAVWPAPYYGPYWGGYGPRFAYGDGRWGGRWGRGWRR